MRNKPAPWWTRIFEGLKWFYRLRQRIQWLEAAVVQHNQRLDSTEARASATEDQQARHGPWLAQLESLEQQQRQRLDQLETLEQQQRQRLDQLETLEQQQRQRLEQLESLAQQQRQRLEQLLSPQAPAFAWKAPQQQWLQRAEARVGRTVATLTAPEKQHAFYSYYSEMGGDQDHVLRQQYMAYLPMLQTAARTGGRVLDIGCGAGELLAFLQGEGISALGLDLSATEVLRATAAGRQAVQGSAVAYLQQTQERFAAITLLQVIEHLSPEEVLSTLQACVQRLLPGGLLMVETINLRHPLALNGFYTDPTHQKPLSDNYMGFLLQWCGLQDVGVLYTLPDPLPGVPADDPTRLYANYTVLGYKEKASH